MRALTAKRGESRFDPLASPLGAGSHALTHGTLPEESLSTTGLTDTSSSDQSIRAGYPLGIFSRLKSGNNPIDVELVSQWYLAGCTGPPQTGVPGQTKPYRARAASDAGWHLRKRCCYSRPESSAAFACSAQPSGLGNVSACQQPTICVSRAVPQCS
jgi:hypothetical protein